MKRRALLRFRLWEPTLFLHRLSVPAPLKWKGIRLVISRIPRTQHTQSRGRLRKATSPQEPLCDFWLKRERIRQSAPIGKGVFFLIAQSGLEISTNKKGSPRKALSAISGPVPGFAGLASLKQAADLFRNSSSRSGFSRTNAPPCILIATLALLMRFSYYSIQTLHVPGQEFDIKVRTNGFSNRHDCINSTRFDSVIALFIGVNGQWSDGRCAGNSLPRLFRSLLQKDRGPSWRG